MLSVRPVHRQLAFETRRIARVVAGLFFAGGLLGENERARSNGTVIGDEVSGSARFAKVDGGGGTSAKHIVSNFFHPQSGEKVATLRIASASLGYEKEGLFRVPWRPVGELADVSIEIIRPSEWPVVAPQLREALVTFGRARVLRLPRFTVSTAGDKPSRIVAEEAEIGREGLVWLRQVEFRAGTDVRRLKRTGLKLFQIDPTQWPAVFATPKNEAGHIDVSFPEKTDFHP